MPLFARYYWTPLLLAIVTVKFTLYGFDHQLQFFMGDSGSYIFTAITDWIPSDRSYTYGRFIRLATLHNQHLELLVPVQVAISALTCLLLALLLVRYLDCSHAIAAGAALLCALDPVLLMYERYAMAENVSLFVFAIFLLVILEYLRGGNPGWLLAAAALGVLAASLRTAFLPPVLTLAALAIGWRILYPGQPPADHRPPALRWAKRLYHLPLFMLVFGALQHYEARPRIHSHTGFFLLAAWSPLLAKPELQPVLSPDPLLDELTRDLKCRLHRLDDRTAQLWLPQCLIGRIMGHFDDNGEANAYALGLAMKLLGNDPLGVLLLGKQTWLHFWDPVRFAGVLNRDRGDAALPQDFIDFIKEHHETDVSGRPATETLTNQLFLNANPWHYWIILSPFFLLLWWLATVRTLNPNSLMVTVAALVLLVVATTLIVGPSIRFFHPVSWLSTIGLASAIDRLWRWTAARRAASSGSRRGARVSTSDRSPAGRR